jgi:hypothetical protein
VINPLTCKTTLNVYPVSASKPSVIKGVTQEQLDNLPEKDRDYVLKNIETTEQVLKLALWRALSEWDFDIREQIYKHFPKIKELKQKDVHFNSITRVIIYGKVPLEKMLVLDPADLKNMISRPGPEPILDLLYKNISWDALMKLDPELRDDVLSLHRPVIELLDSKLIIWDQIIGLPRDFFKEIIQRPQIIINWMQLGVKWKDIVATPVEIFKSLCVIPHKMTPLLECTSWTEIVDLEPNLRALALQKAYVIMGWKTEEKISWQDCLERLKTNKTE